MFRFNQIRKIAVTAICAYAIAVPAMAQSSLEDLIEKAGQEGEIVFNTLTTRTPAKTGSNLSAALQEKFGVDISVKMTTGAPAGVMAGTVMSEMKAGIRPSSDTLTMPLFTSSELDAAGNMEDIDWAAIGVPEVQISPSGHSVWVRTTPRTVVYNTNLVTGDDIPTRLEDLLDPKWRGKIAGPINGDSYATGVVPVLGEEAGVKWLEALYNDQDLALIPIPTDIPNRVANGEFPIGFGLSANYAGLVDKGAPIANAPIEKVTGVPYYQFVLKGAEHPNAAALVIYFLCCTAEGKQAMLEEMNWGLFDTEGSEPYEIAQGGRGVIPSAEWQLNEQGRVGIRLEEVLRH